MAGIDLLRDAFGRINAVVHSAVEDLDAEQLASRIDGEANSIAWLVWHLTRVQDDHIAAAAGTSQAWTSQGWSKQFDLPLPDDATGYGHGSAQVGVVQVRAELLLGYLDAVHDRTMSYLDKLTDADLDRVVDERWDPPVTLAVRLVSVISDDLQHAGQAAFIRGVVQRR